MAFGGIHENDEAELCKLLLEIVVAGCRGSLISRIEQSELDPCERLPFEENLTAARCLKNCFTDEALTVGRVVLDFTLPDGGVAIPSMRWSIGTRRPTTHPFFSAMA